ncbi:hypothetical protein BH10BDE1_BH10BDE1_01340 [soil metagenome]
MKNLLRAFVLLMLAATMTASVSAQAQAPTQKRVVKIDDSTGELVDITEAQEVAQQAPGIVILNNQKSTQTAAQASKQAQTAIQDQPTNVIEDSPLNMSAAERRRRDRQNLEMQTEQKIVEKLEDARIEDERARGERLFNKGFQSRDERQEVAPAPAPQQVQVIQAPAVVVEKKEEPKVNVKEEIRAALDEMKPKHEEAMTGYYMQGLAGMGNYPDATNVRGDMALGFGFGIVTPERFVAEGTFQYSQYSVTDPSSSSYYQPNYGSSGQSIPFTKVTQYNFQAAVKYQLLGGRVRPVVGLIAGYTYRGYEGQNSLYTQYYGSGSQLSNNASTNALDLGGLLGLDVQVTNTFSIGADFRYMKNVAYRGNNDYSNAYALPAPFKRLEEINYYLASLVGKFTF